jgi:hypothetical protein
MKTKTKAPADTAECRVEVEQFKRFPQVGDHIPTVSPMTDIKYDVKVTGIKGMEWSEYGTVIVTVKGVKTELPDDYNYNCEDCGVYCGAAVNPITGGTETLCYDCAQKREDKRKAEEARQWKYVQGDARCSRGFSCVRLGTEEEVRNQGPREHEWREWGSYRKCACGATQARVEERAAEKAGAKR